MAKRKTRLLLEIKWDDELDQNPMTWDVPALMKRDPFTDKGEQIRVISFEDVVDNVDP